MEGRIAFAKKQRNVFPDWLSTPGRWLFVWTLIVNSSFLPAQQVELNPNATSLLAWPFEDSFPIDYFSGSHSWQMICGHNCGLHHGVDRFALDWSTYRATSCGWGLQAPIAGTIIYVERNSNTGYGNQIVLQSTQDSTFAVRMAHLQAVSASVGDTVEVGDLIGWIGETGNGGCHLHIVLYQAIYEISDPNYNPLDTITTWRRAIDDLKRNRFIDMAEPFSATFQFQSTDQHLYVASVDGPGSFWPNDRVVEGHIELINQDTQRVSGKMILRFSEDEESRQSLDVTTTNTFTLQPGEQRSIRFSAPVIPDAGRYSFLQVAYSDEKYPDYSGKIYTQPVYFYEESQCLIGEPNNQPASGELLTFGGSPKMEELERFLGPEGDSIDFYRVEALRAGLLRIEQQSGPYLTWMVVDSSGKPQTISTPEHLELPVEPGEVLYLRASGQGNCFQPYRLTISWEPDAAGEWLLWQQDNLLQTSFDAGHAASVEVAIFNALGQRVAFFQKEITNAGMLERQWLLPNVPTGIYWVRIYTDQGEEFARKIWWTN